MSKISYNVISQIASEHHYTMVQEEHRKYNYKFYGSEEFIQALAKANVRHIAIEYPEFQQESIDAFYEGKISKRELLKQLTKTEQETLGSSKILIYPAKDIARMVDNAKEAGIKVHAVDRFGAIACVKAFMIAEYNDKDEKVTVGDLREKLEEELQKATPGTPRYKFLKSASIICKINMSDHASIESFAMALTEPGINERSSGDKEVAERIIKATGGEKAAVIYGAGHGASSDGKSGKDLDEYLTSISKGRSVGKIALHALTEYPFKEYPSAYIALQKGNFLSGLQSKVFLSDDYKLGAEIPKSKINSADYRELLPTDLIKNFSQQHDNKTAIEAGR